MPRKRRKVKAVKSDERQVAAAEEVIVKTEDHEYLLACEDTLERLEDHLDKASGMGNWFVDLVDYERTTCERIAVCEDRLILLDRLTDDLALQGEKVLEIDKQATTVRHLKQLVTVALLMCVVAVITVFGKEIFTAIGHYREGKRNSTRSVDNATPGADVSGKPVRPDSPPTSSADESAAAWNSPPSASVDSATSRYYRSLPVGSVGPDVPAVGRGVVANIPGQDPQGIPRGPLEGDDQRRISDVAPSLANVANGEPLQKISQEDDQTRISSRSDR